MGKKEKAEKVWLKMFNLPLKEGDVVEVTVKRTPTDNYHLVHIQIEYIGNPEEWKYELHGVVVKAPHLKPKLLGKPYCFKTKDVRRVVRHEE